MSWTVKVNFPNRAEAIKFAAETDEKFRLDNLIDVAVVDAERLTAYACCEEYK